MTRKTIRKCEAENEDKAGDREQVRVGRWGLQVGRAGVVPLRE